MPNQLEELSQWFLDKSFSNFKQIHSKNETVVNLPEEQRNDFIQERFDNLFNIEIKEINKIRQEGKTLMLTEGNYFNALENSFMRAYISLERIEPKKGGSESQQQLQKTIQNEILVKILKHMYVCISLRPDYIADQQQQDLQQLSGRSKKSSQRIKLDHKLLLEDIAKDIYMVDVYNLGKNSKTNQVIKPKV